MSCRVLRSHGAGDSNSAELLLRDIEEISEALYLDKRPSRRLIAHSGRNPALKISKSGSTARLLLEEDFFCNDKKPSSWSWSPLKVLTHLRNRRFNICFFIRAHSIQGLSSSFNGQNMCIRWKRKEELRTRCSKVHKGTAKFDEILMHQCSVYGSRKGPNQSAKYEPKHFLLYADLFEAPGFDTGKHWIDLTKLLPLTFEELEQDKSMGMWTASFKLSGKAKGALLTASFGFLAMGGNAVQLNRNHTIPELISLSRENSKFAKSVGNFVSSHGTDLLDGADAVSSRKSTNTKALEDVRPSQCRTPSCLGRSSDRCNQDEPRQKNSLSQKSEIIKPIPLLTSEPCSILPICGSNDIEVTVVERGIEFSTEEHVMTNVDSIETLHGFTRTAFNASLGETYPGPMNKTSALEYAGQLECTENQCVTGVPVEKHERVLHSQTSEPTTSVDADSTRGNYRCVGGNLQCSRTDDASDVDADEAAFLNFLCLAQDVGGLNLDSSGSPREALLREFEKDVCGFENYLCSLDECGEGRISGSNLRRPQFEDSVDLPFAVLQPSILLGNSSSSTLKCRRNMRMPEGLSTEMAMEGGRNLIPGGFGSPIHVSPHQGGSVQASRFGSPEGPSKEWRMGTTRFRSYRGGVVRSSSGAYGGVSSTGVVCLHDSLGHPDICGHRAMFPDIEFPPGFFL